MIRFRENPAGLSYAAVQTVTKQIDPVLAAELRKVKNQNSSLKTENKFLWFVAGVNALVIVALTGIPAIMDWLAMV